MVDDEQITAFITIVLICFSVYMVWRAAGRAPMPERPARFLSAAWMLLVFFLYLPASLGVGLSLDNNRAVAYTMICLILGGTIVGFLLFIKKKYLLASLSASLGHIFFLILYIFGF